MPFQPVLPEPLPESPFRQSPLLILALLMIVGIVMGWCFVDWVNWGTWCIAGGVCTVLALILYLFEIYGAKKNVWCWVVAALSFVMYGGAWCVYSLNSISVQWPKEVHTWEARVVNVQRMDSTGVVVDVVIKAYMDTLHNNQQATCAQQFVKHVDNSFYDKKVRVRLENAAANSVIEGDGILFHASVNGELKAQNPTDFNYRNYLLTHGISGQAYVRNQYWIKMRDEGAQQMGWRSQLLRYRRTMLQTYRKYIPDANALAVISALTLGDKSLLHTGLREVFSETGTSHVLALSGLHLGILFFLFNAFLIRPLGRRSQRIVMSLFTVACLWTFTFLAGAPLSLLRSVTMLTMVQLGVILRRSQNATLNNLSLAAIVLLIADPLSLFDVGFQLSFMAVLSILLCNQYIWQRFKLPLWENVPWISTYSWKRRSDLSWREHVCLNIYPLCKHALKKHTFLFFRNKIFPFITVSLSAQWGTMPLIISYFHLITPYAFIANFVVIPSAMVLLSSSVVFFALPIECVQTFVAKVMQYVLQFMTATLTQMTHLPLATIKVYLSAFLPWLIIILPICLYIYANVRYRSQRRWAVAMFFVFLTLGVSIEVHQRYAQRVVPQLCVYKMPRATSIHFVHSAKTSYLYLSSVSDTTRQRMLYLKEHYFAPHHMAEPQQLPCRDVYKNKYIAHNNQAFIFHHKSVYLLKHNVFRQKRAVKEVINVDFLIVGFGCWKSLQDVYTLVRPHQVILSSDLPYRMRQLWKAQCVKARIPCHDVNEQGAFMCKL